MDFKVVTTSFLIIIFSVLSGCSTYNPVNIEKKSITLNSHYYDFLPEIYVGDHVKYSLLNGYHGEITISKINPCYITDDKGVVIPLSEVSRMERKDFSTGKTAALAGGGVAATAVIIVLAGIAIIGFGTMAALTS
ncbi:hypothetical protein [Cedecea sp. FDAARGOS_727]|uniref:hypothetical protein n=1 Tax=Cedecea sp. FDAARGOS_727 TaxID=2545798 RepID=UPI00143E7AA1|nr:hypothetical protein [Cedecea sp. FDAARGOS_727]QIX96966.1 hypothetical protein FOC35_15300 [Cedecea sp. FDAARGOS_727]